jgi:hypothetical protein
MGTSLAAGLFMRHPCVDFPAVWAVAMCVLAARRCVILLHLVPVLFRDHLPRIFKIIFKYDSMDNFQWIAVPSPAGPAKTDMCNLPFTKLHLQILASTGRLQSTGSGTGNGPTK